jgi:hypothetical protein
LEPDVTKRIDRDARNGRFVGLVGAEQSVFLRPRRIAGERPGDAPVRLRDDVHERALEAAKKVLRSYRSESRRVK